MKFVASHILNIIFYSSFCNGANLYLYTKQNEKDDYLDIKPKMITRNDISNVIDKLKQDNYFCWTNRHKCLNYFIIHGFFDVWDAKWVNNMKNALFKHYQKSNLVNVFVVDWPTIPLNPLDYIQVVKENMKPAYKEISTLTQELIEKEYISKKDKTIMVHCIGFSLGAHL